MSRHVYQVKKPLRSIALERPIKRLLSVSLGPWPKNTKWHSQNPITHTLEDIDRVWLSSFRTLKMPPEMQVWTYQDVAQFLRYFLDLPSGRDHTNEKWVGLQGPDFAQLFRNVLLWCLKYRKKSALLLLLATFKGRKYRPPRYMISDSLHFLARYFLFNVSNPDPMAVDAIWFLTRKFIEGADDQEQEFAVDQQVIFNLLEHSDDARVVSLYWLLSTNKAVLHADTMLQFLNRFVDMGKIELSMKLLDTVAKTGHELYHVDVQMACVKLLRARSNAQTEYAFRSNILKQILEMGVRPDIHMFNTILLNAGEGGDFDNAWRMYHLAKGSALTPDPITFCVLLKGAKLSGDYSNLERVIREIQSNGKVLQDLRVVGDVLHAISLISPGDEFGAMLNFYKQHCDVRPLQELSLLGNETQVPPGGKSQGLRPTSTILNQMILAYIKIHEGSLDLMHIYERYYQGVKENHPLIAPLAVDDVVANAFITAFGKKSNTLQHCTTVVKHMIEFSSPNFATSYKVAYKAPTVQTWTILIATYFSWGQRRAAKKVLDMMLKRGIGGDKVTWNVLIKGYALSQDVNAVADTVKSMEAAGSETDDYTIKALGILWRQDLLARALDRSRTEIPINESTIPASLPSLGPEEEFEAYTNDQWESRVSYSEGQVRRYWEAKVQEQVYPEFEKSSDSLGETVMGVIHDP